MAQLKMYWLSGTPIQTYELPEGYSVSNYKTEEDKYAWIECCKYGLVGEDAGTGAFDNCMYTRRGLVPENDTFFLDYHGEHIGTVTAFIHEEDGIGDMHMVGIRRDFRGKGLSKYLTQITLQHLEGRVPYIDLTTDEWRRPAVKGYLAGGFLPVNYEEWWMERRWQNMIDNMGIDAVQMLNDDATPYKTLYRTKTYQIGVFGVKEAIALWQNKTEKCTISAMCGRCEHCTGTVHETCGDAITYDTDYEAFLHRSMNAVWLGKGMANAERVMSAMSVGLDVLAGDITPKNMKEAVALLELAEGKTKSFVYTEQTELKDTLISAVRRFSGETKFDTKDIYLSLQKALTNAFGEGHVPDLHDKAMRAMWKDDERPLSELSKV